MPLLQISLKAPKLTDSAAEEVLPAGPSLWELYILREGMTARRALPPALPHTTSPYAWLPHCL